MEGMNAQLEKYKYGHNTNKGNAPHEIQKLKTNIQILEDEKYQRAQLIKEKGIVYIYIYINSDKYTK